MNYTSIVFYFVIRFLEIVTNTVREDVVDYVFLNIDWKDRIVSWIDDYSFYIIFIICFNWFMLYFNYVLILICDVVLILLISRSLWFSLDSTGFRTCGIFFSVCNFWTPPPLICPPTWVIFHSNFRIFHWILNNVYCIKIPIVSLKSKWPRNLILCLKAHAEFKDQ